MLIVFEGVDGAGKSTLVETIEKRLADAGRDVRTTHHGPPERHPLEEYVLDYDWYAPESDVDLLVDRLHIGELIYGPLYRGESQLGEAGRRYVDLYLRSRGGLMVYVDAPLGVIQARLESRGEDYLQTHHVEHVWSEYKTMRHTSHAVPATTITTTTATDDQVALALATASALERQAAPMYEVTKGRHLGTPEPLTVLVGEETSPRHLRGERPTYLAPFVPYADGCGRHLIEHLPAGLLSRVMIVNAAEVDLSAVAAAAPRADFIALGQVADVALTTHDVDHATVPHPQRVRRFHHARLPEYGALIGDVAGTTRQELSWP